MSDLKPWATSTVQVLQKFQVNPEKGLSEKRVPQLVKLFGRNSISTQKPPGWVEIFIRQFKSLLVGLLALAAVVAFLTGDSLDAIAIILVLLVNSIIGFVTELRAVKSMESLRKMGQTLTRALREEKQSLIPSEDLVPGDILILEAGDIVTADCRILESHNLTIDESALTGESVPVDKKSNIELEGNTSVSDRINMLMKGTHITRGACKAVVTSTGMNTELGQIASLTSSAKEEVTPLEKRLDRLGRKLLWLTLFISIFIFVSGLLSGKDLVLMIQTAIALAVATVPEGLPIVATIALARGLWTMASRNALINKLSAVETLGATSIIVTDKTGTLTENKMTVSEIVTKEGIFSVQFNSDSQKLTLIDTNKATVPFNSASDNIKYLVQVVGLCNDAQYEPGREAIGDPMEIALARFSYDLIDGSVDIKSLYPRRSEVPFDTETKMMASLHSFQDGTFIGVKGAPEAVLEKCNMDTTEREIWLQRNKELADQGHRVLATAYKVNPKKGEEVYGELQFLGLIGLIDPARQDVPQSISLCQRAGIRVIMATGDQGGTAAKIAKDIGLPEDSLEPILGRDLEGEWNESIINNLERTSIFSRVSPEQKLRLVEYYQKKQAVVAMTGDGVNDAPALKKADIGVAMGLRGTQVAKEAADMILKDDRFESIVYAIEQGRIIFSNIRKFVIYLLSCNISEVFVVGLASIFSNQLPITPLQILFLNLVTDVFPALALGMGAGDSSYLTKPPRGSDEKILEKPHWHFIFFYGSLMTATVLGVFFYFNIVQEAPFEKVVTLSFLTLGISQIFHVFNLRKSGTSLFFNEITKNIHVWGAIVFCLGLFIVSVHLPVLQNALGLVALSPQEWLTVLLCSFIPSLGQLVIRLK